MCPLVQSRGTYIYTNGTLSYDHGIIPAGALYKMCPQKWSCKMCLQKWLYNKWSYKNGPIKNGPIKNGPI